MCQATRTASGYLWNLGILYSIRTSCILITFRALVLSLSNACWSERMLGAPLLPFMLSSISMLPLWGRLRPAGRGGESGWCNDGSVIDRHTVDEQSLSKTRWTPPRRAPPPEGPEAPGRCLSAQAPQRQEWGHQKRDGRGMQGFFLALRDIVGGYDACSNFLLMKGKTDATWSSGCLVFDGCDGLC